MRRILCVAEKNDVAKGVATILSRGSFNRREGRSPYNKIYQFQLEVMGQQAIMMMTSVSGHLMNYSFGPECKSWEVREFYGHTTLNCSDDADGISFRRTVEARGYRREESAKADTLIIWTDCDREGENIGAEIVKVCKDRNRAIDVYRAKFSEITPQAIHNAMRNLLRVDQRIVDAVDCRSELDLRIGAAFTRLQTLHLRRQFAHLMGDSNGSNLASYGSCQFPTLGFIVERYKAIQEFVQEPFWKLVVEHTRDGMKVEFTWDRVRLFNRDIVNVLYDDCREARAAKIIKVATKPKSKWRPQPLDTVELEKLAIRKLRMSAKQVMQIAEKLYNQGFISYPRTETNKFAPDIDLNRLAQIQTSSDVWGSFADQVVERGATPRNGNKSDEAHPPIHPLKFASRNTMQAPEWSVYELIVRHFLACISWDATGKETRVDLACGGETFNTTGLHITDLGYMNVYVYDKWSDKTIPGYAEGETLSDHILKISDGQTQPPSLLNEADLIALMDKFGIGTDATHAEHIDKIKTRQYVQMKNDGRFLPGILGLGLVEGYDDMGFAMSKPHLRADLERQLQAICAGTRRKQDVLEEQKTKYRRIFEQTELQVMKLSQAMARNINNNNLMAAVAQVPQAQGQQQRGRRGARGRGNGGNAPQASNNDVTFDSSRRGRGRRGGTTSTRGNRGEGASTGQGSAVAATGKQCQCGAAPVMRTVNKEGPNKGKQFWTCGKAMGDPTKCNFFEWV